MNRTELLNSLMLLTKFLRADLAQPLSRFATYLESLPDKSLFSKLDSLNKRRAKNQIPPRSPEKLRESLKYFAQLLTIGGTKKSAESIRKLLRALPTEQDCTVEVFIEDLRKLDQGKPAAKKKVVPLQANRELAQQLANELFASKNDKERFPSILMKLKNSKQVNTPTLHLTANLFLNRRSKFRNRKPAIEAINRRHMDELRYAFQKESLESLRR